MSFLIDAWFERSNPRLRLLDCATGTVVASFDQIEIQKLCDWGEFSIKDFTSSAYTAKNQLIKNLLLAEFARQIGTYRLSDKISLPKKLAHSAEILLFPI